jgi:hypothetical protein
MTKKVKPAAGATGVRRETFNFLHNSTGQFKKQPGNRSRIGGSPQNRIRTARQKIRVLSGFSDLRRYFTQIKKVHAYLEVSR